MASVVVLSSRSWLNVERNNFANIWIANYTTRILYDVTIKLANSPIAIVE